MDFTAELRAKAEKNKDNPRVLLEILRDVLRWRRGPTHDLEVWIIDSVAPHVEPCFVWPDTETSPAEGKLATDDWPDRGLLGAHHYSARRDGPNKYERRVMLGMVYGADATEYLPEDEANDWGPPRSRARLRKMVNSLAAFARNAKHKKDDSLRQAIGKWESDLEYLKDNFSRRHSDFSWPKYGYKDENEEGRSDGQSPDLFGA